MMKPKRKKVVKLQLENELAKCERRIQTIANHAYQLRQAIDAITRQEQKAKEAVCQPSK